MLGFGKIKEIIQSYATMVNPTEEQKVWAEKRLQTCMGCLQWKQNAMGIDYCGKCGCATAAKIFSPKGVEACPLGLWTI
jgi:hypothetical protein